MNNKVFRKRVVITGIIAAVAALYFVVKFSSLHFSSKIVVPQNKNSDVRRGYIKDKNGYILALSIEMNSLYANPEEVTEPEKTARAIAPFVDFPIESLREKLSRKKRFVWLKRRMDDISTEKIKKLSLPGIYFKKEYRRVYPNSSLASNITGFVGIDGDGLDGIEFSYDSILSGRDAEYGDTSPPLGKNVVLTIDRFTQHLCESELETAVRASRAKQGVALVMEVKTGRILSLAKYPSYDPNYYSDYTQAERRNFTVIDSFEPGSTMKIISMASILETGRDVLNESYKCEGAIDIADETIKCTGVHGVLKTPDIIKYSCNVGVIKLIKNHKKDTLYSTLKKFGFGSKTDSGFPGETEGILRPVASWSGLSKFSLAIGHELAATSIQLAAAFSAIANGGIYVMPSITESIENPDGTVSQQYYSKTKGRVISKENADILLRLMRGVVESGTGKKAESTYYQTAGKTGTSQKFMIKSGSYSDRVTSSFIGIAPYKNPEVCVLVVIDDPNEAMSGGHVAAPVFSRIVDRVLPYMGIKSEQLKAKPPMQSREKKFKFESMPDFRGQRLADSVRALIDMQTSHNIEYSISGTGKVFDQKPLPGKKLEQKEKIFLYLRGE